MGYAVPAADAVSFGLASGYTAPAADAVVFQVGGASLSAAGTITVSGQAHLGLPKLSAAGTITVSGQAQLHHRSLSAAGTVSVQGLATLAQPSLSAAGVVTVTALATLRAAVRLVAAGTITVTGQASLTPGDQYSLPAGDAVTFALASGYTAPAADAVDFATHVDPGGSQPEPLPVSAGVNSSYGSSYRSARVIDLRTRAPYGAYRRPDARVTARSRAPDRAERATAGRWGPIPTHDHRAGGAWARTSGRPQWHALPTWRQLDVHDQRVVDGWDGSIAPRHARARPHWIVPPARDLLQREPYDHVDVKHPHYPARQPYQPPASDAVELDVASGYGPPAADSVVVDLRPALPNRRIQPRTGADVPSWRRRVGYHDAKDVLPWGPRGRVDSVGIEIDYPQEPPPPPPEPIVVPDRERYLLMPSIEAQRVSDGLVVWLNSVRINTDRDSWAWQLEAVPARSEDLDAVKPGGSGPVELQVTVNGTSWVFLIEGYSRQRAFNSSSYSISGRSRSAYLAAPYSPATTATEGSQKTAQQLAVAQLEFTSWTLDWQAQDWTVPGNVWSYENLSPIQAITRIAEAVGAVVQVARSDQVLHVVPRYPVSPWEWAGATPDLVLPEGAVAQLSMRWEPAPLKNAVYVAGKTQGVLVHTIRSGSAADKEAPMIVDQLVVERLAGRERGRQELAKSGNRGSVSIKTFMLPDPEPPGLIEPGTLVEVQEGGESWHGQVMATSVNASRQNAASVRQTIEVERYHDE